MLLLTRYFQDILRAESEEGLSVCKKRSTWTFFALTPRIIFFFQPEEDYKANLWKKMIPNIQINPYSARTESG